MAAEFSKGDPRRVALLAGMLLAAGLYAPLPSQKSRRSQLPAALFRALEPSDGWASEGVALPPSTAPRGNWFLFSQGQNPTADAFPPAGELVGASQVAVTAGFGVNPLSAFGGADILVGDLYTWMASHPSASGYTWTEYSEVSAGLYGWPLSVYHYPVGVTPSPADSVATVSIAIPSSRFGSSRVNQSEWVYTAIPASIPFGKVIEFPAALPVRLRVPLSEAATPEKINPADFRTVPAYVGVVEEFLATRPAIPLYTRPLVGPTGIIEIDAGSMPRFEQVTNTVHALSPPSPRTREVKVKPTGGKTARFVGLTIKAVGDLYGQATEIVDFVEALYKAVPYAYKPRMVYKNGATSPFVRKYPSLEQKIQAVYRTLSDPAAVDNFLSQGFYQVMLNQIQDALIGGTGHASTEMAKDLGLPTGSLPAGAAYRYYLRGQNLYAQRVERQQKVRKGK